MPLTNAEKQQVDEYLKSNRPNLARVMLQDYLKDNPFDESARKVLAKINKLHPPTSSTPTPAFSMPAPSPTPAPARKLQSDVLPKITPKPTPTHAASDENDIEAIKQAIREKRYDDAEALLVLSDHPDADKLRDRLGAIRGGAGGSVEKVKHVYVQTDKDFTGRLSITIFLLIFLTLFGLIALAVWLPEAKRYPDAPGAQGLILANKVVTWILRAILAIILLFFALLIFSYLTRPGQR